jgi:hypothetical protein
LIDANLNKFTPNKVDPKRRKYWSFVDGVDAALSAKKLELIERFKIRGWILYASAISPKAARCIRTPIVNWIKGCMCGSICC